MAGSIATFMQCILLLGIEDRSNFVLPSSTQLLNDEEEADLFIQETLQSQNEFQGMDLNQVTYSTL